MSPPPFNPRHDTPFKSSLSSSQQARKHQPGPSSSLTSGDEWPRAFDADQLDPRHWTYLAEGGKNLLLRYTGPEQHPFVGPKARRVALRLTKQSRQATSPSTRAENVDEDDDNDGGKDDIDAMAWQRTVLQSDLGQDDQQEILPPLLRVEGSQDHIVAFLRVIGNQIETSRPMKRRKASGIDAERTKALYITEDLSAPVRNRPCLILEIKPKCGFLPDRRTAKLSAYTAPHKTTVSRFRMHAILKHRSDDSDEAMSKDVYDALYDPLDLYSGQPDRIDKAADALFRVWEGTTGNNLRIFLDGGKVDPAHAEKAETLARSLWSDEVDLRGAVRRTLRLPVVQDLLAKLRVLQQRYDPLDVEGVHQTCMAERSKGLDELGNEPAISLDEYQALVARLGGGSGEDGACLSAREAVAGFLLSASYKDCSLFVRISSPAEQNASSDPDVSVHLVDLDPKPTSKLPYLYAIDQQIVQTYSTWAQEHRE